jgi:hypothetical protein
VRGDVVLESGADKGVGAERDAKVDERVVRMEDRAGVRRANVLEYRDYCRIPGISGIHTLY